MDEAVVETTQAYDELDVKLFYQNLTAQTEARAAAGQRTGDAFGRAVGNVKPGLPAAVENKGGAPEPVGLGHDVVEILGALWPTQK